MVSFLLEKNYFKLHDDLKYDHMGSWKHNGSPKRWFSVKKNVRGIKSIDCVEKKPENTNDDIFQLKRTYYKNNSDETVRKIVAKLEGMHCHHTLFFLVNEYYELINYKAQLITRKWIAIIFELLTGLYCLFYE